MSGQDAIDHQQRKEKYFSTFYDTLVEIQNLIIELNILKESALAKNAIDLSGYLQGIKTRRIKGKGRF